MAKKKDSGGGKKSTDIPAWMASFTDMVTLLFCFFVLLFAMAEIDPARMRDISQHFSPRPTIVEMIGSDSLFELMSSGIENVPDPGDRIAERQARILELEELFANIDTQFMTYFADDIVFADAQIVDTGEGLYYLHEIIVHLPIHDEERGAVLFESAQHVLLPGAHDALAAIGLFLQENPGAVIEITGHTDNIPYRTGPFADPDGLGFGNLSLSHHRAMSVMQHFMVVYGISHERIEVRGAGEWEPMDTNETAEGRQRNRRVDLRIFMWHLIENDN